MSVALIPAQTLYWVGGSGNFSDPAHWSLNPGGNPANTTPIASNAVVFDDHSGIGTSAVTISGTVSVKSLQVVNSVNSVYFTGNSHAVLNCAGSLSLSDYGRFDLQGAVVFRSAGGETNLVSFGILNTLSCDVFFEEGNYSVTAIAQNPGHKISFEKGTYGFKHSSLKTDHLEIKNTATRFRIDTTYFLIHKTVLVKDKPDFTSNVFTFYAPFSTPGVSIPADVSFGSNRVVSSDNSISSVCGASVYAYPSCSGLCTGIYSVVIDPVCTSTYNILVTNTTCPSAANDLSASDITTSYTFANACGCTSNYLIDVYDQVVVALLPITFVVGGTGGGNFNFNAPNFNLLPLITVTPSCNQTCNGSMTLGVSGGTQPFTVSTSSSLTPASFTSSGVFSLTSLCGGLYSFTITDSYGCIGTSTRFLNSPTLLNPNPVTRSITCNGACNGSFSITPNNSGTSGYTVNFNPGGTSAITGTHSAVVSGLCPGPISATVTDAKGCTVTASSNITQPSPIVAAPAQTNVICGGSCTGAASVAVSGGVSPYTYSWSSPGGTLAGTHSLCAGNYSVTVKDNNNCTYSPTPTFTITQSTPIVLSFTSANVSCHGLSNGSVAVSATGGSAPVTFTWIASAGTVISTSSSITAIGADTYTVFATDAVGCTITKTITITQPPSLTITATSQSVTCIAACNGVATVSVSGGNGAPFSYTWAPTVPTQTTSIAINLCAGNYLASVLDASSCPISTLVTIIQPTTFTPAVTTASLSCNGVCTGSIGVAISGGTAPYNYTLSSAASSTASATPSFTGLCAGVYTLSISDASSPCPQIFTVSVVEPAAVIPSISSTSVTCFNACNGILTANAFGGVPGYSYSWITPTGNVAAGVLNNRCAGDYTLNVTDAHGCIKSTTTALLQPSDITFTITPANATCFSSCNGALSANVLGGTPGYSLNWSNGLAGTPNTSLCVGVYTLMITDHNSCSKTGTAAITSPNLITLTQTTGITACATSCDGSATITAAGGMPSYVYAFDTFPAITNTTGVTHALCAGNYVANVTDQNGCSQSIVFSISSPAALSAAITGTQGSCSSCTGASTVTAANGSAGYSYVWTNSLSTIVSNSNTATALCTGNYTVVITDSKSCTATASINIVETVVAAPVTGGTGIQCYSDCTGSAVVSPNGGTGPYTYTWMPTGQTTQTATALCAGIYTVTVKEGSASGCTSTSTVNIVSPPALTVTAIKTNVTCAGLCNGVINAVASGGTGVLSYSWSPGGQTSSTINGLCAGTYSLRVTDADGCMAPVQVFTVTAPPAITASFTSIAPTTCTMSNGSICVSGGGGSGGPYAYNWLPAVGNTSCITGLAAGAYSVTVSDVTAGCSTTLSTLLNNPSGPTLTVVGTQSIACFGGSTGAATISASGSTPITFIWAPVVTFTNSGSTSIASGLGTGTYVLTASDVNSCVRSITVPIVQASQLNVSATITNPKCNNAVCNGSVVIAPPTGGTPGYTYSWVPGGVTSQNLPNVCAGIYSLTITDSHVCHNTYTYAVVAPPVFTITTTASNIKCNGVCNGSIVANASGGTAPISYSWASSGPFTGSTTATVLNLCAGIYTVNAQDGNNCQAQGTNTVHITEPAVLTTTLNLQNASCSNSCNAVANLLVAGGTLPYAYSWSTGSAIIASIGGLCAGNYTGTISDANGCVSAKGFTVTLPAPFTATVVPANPKCNPLSNPVCTGSVATILSGAQGSVSFNWLPSGSGQNPTNLCSGSYTLVATDANLCQVLGVVNLIDPPALISDVTFTNPSCHGACNGIAITTPTNAQGAVSVSWTPATGSSPTINSLCAGNYTVNIADANGCLDVQTFTLTDPPTLNVNSSNSAASCTVANGSITAIASGGAPGAGGYTYLWSPPAVSTTSIATNLAAGIYTLAVSDGLCTNTVFIPLSSANGPTFAPITSTNVACNGLCTGAASIDIATISGGAPGYTVSWLAPPATSSINPLTNLCAGIYTAKINDLNNCVLFETVNITQPNAISTLPGISFPTCVGVCNGSVSLATSGGAGAYTYSWLPAVSNSSVLMNACSGNYTVTIGYGGAANCTSPPQVVNLPAVSNMNITTGVTPNPCFGNCSATAFITGATGIGSAQFDYSWSNGQNGTQAYGFCNGNYSVMATAPNGCTSTFTFAVTSPPTITSTVAVTQPSCNQCNGSASINASGGSGSGFSYNWSTSANSASVSGLCAGLYQVTITEGEGGCPQTKTVVVNNSNGISGEIVNTQNILCAGICNGSATVTATGGNGAIAYNWLNPVISNSVLTNLCAGTYYVQMSDAQGCLRTSSVAITAATSLSLSEFILQPDCIPPTTGAIDVLVTGGTPAYTYSWEPSGSTTASLSNISAGVYTLIVTDGSAAHCSLTQVYNVSNSGGPVLTFTQTNINCFGSCTGSISVGVIGSGVATFSWSNGSTSPVVTGLCSGPISLTVTGANGCISIKSFNVTENPPLHLNLPQIAQPTCNLCNGGATITPFGGVAPYTYIWTNNASSAAVTGLCSGIYEVTVADALSCQQSSTLIINNSNGISGESFTTQSISCGGNCNGSATVTAIGGSAPITYQWLSPSVTNPIITNLCANTYYIQMVDAQHCMRTASVDITAATNLTITAHVTSPDCNATDGAINLLIAGGTPTYGIVWQPGGNTTSTLSNIGAGSYSVTIQDSAPGTCTVMQTFHVNNVTGPFISATQTNVACFGALTGAVTVSASTAGNPAAAFAYHWSDGSVGASISNLGESVITLTVTDTGTGCISIKSFTITQSPEITINPPAVVQPSCNLCNGTASVSVFGGVAPYQYVWTNSAATPVISGLCAGIYQVQVTDALQCQKTQNVIINNSNGISGQNFTIQNILCGGNCNGSATVAAVGGNAPITYQWINPVVTSPVITNLCAGNYFVQMVDVQNCIRTASIDITAATSLTVSGIIASPSCNNNNGSVNLTIAGGTPSYNISWFPGGSAGSALSGIGAGSYTVTVHDSPPGTCTVVQAFNVSNTTGPVVIATQTNVNCFGACTGVISASASTPGNPAAAFAYDWSSGSGSSTASGLCQGVITLTVTDVSTGCKTIKTFTITENPELHINTPSLAQPFCNQCNGTASISVFGGVAPYQYVWTNGATAPAISDLCAGLYQVQVTDAKQCQKTDNVVINNSAGITGENFNVQPIQCADLCNGAATVTAIGGTSPINYSWINPFVAGNTLQNLCDGNYYVQMSDAAGCIRTASIAIAPATDFTISISAVPPTCGVIPVNGSISVSVSGGSGSYQYSWTPAGSTSSQLNNVGVGIYSLQVRDAVSGCSHDAMVNLSNPSGPVVQFAPSEISCFGTCTGSVTAASTSTDALTYVWSAGTTLSAANSSTVTGLCKGIVTVTVTDNVTSCAMVNAFDLDENNELQLSIPNVVEPTCNNSCNGQITLLPSGGTLPYQSFSWTPAGSGSNPQTGLCAGTGDFKIYTVTITDAKGCISSTTVQLNNPSPIVVSYNQANASCPGVADGSVSVAPAGGTPGYSLTWSGPNGFTANTADIIKLFPGRYGLHVQDQEGCQQDTAVNLVSTVSLQANAGADATVCPTGSVVLTGTNSTGSTSFTYNWYTIFNSVTPVSVTDSLYVPVATETSTLYLQINSSVQGCFDRDTVLVTVLSGPVIDAGPSHTIQVYSNVTIGGDPTAFGNVTISWSPNLTLSDSTIANPVASNTLDLTYTLTVKDNSSGCVNTATTQVILYPAVDPPSGFTPNGDGKNDRWIIDYMDQFPDNTVEVYNRWGDQLFYSKGYNTPFDGRYHSKDLPAGTYYFIINLNHPAYPKPITGPLTIFR